LISSEEKVQEAIDKLADEFSGDPNLADCHSHQTISAEGYSTSAYYYIHMEPMDWTTERIWKEATSDPPP